MTAVKITDGASYIYSLSGRNAVGYLTESVHGAGSPQAQRIQIGRMMQLEYKKRLANILARIEIDHTADIVNELGDYFERVFKEN
ncbi:MAG: 4-hydroxyphenylacetate 3-hydroxylase C-terminal domain-containing protein [Flavobacteriaceae bacterium]